MDVIDLSVPAPSVQRWRAGRRRRSRCQPSAATTALIQNCPICAREQHVELRPVVSPGGASDRTGADRAAGPVHGPGNRAPRAARSGSGRGVTVRKLVRGVDDGYRSGLVARVEVKRRCRAAGGGARLRGDATSDAGVGIRPVCIAEVAERSGDLEERTWLAFLIAYVGPLEDRAAVRSRSSASAPRGAPDQPPELRPTELGPRRAHHQAGRGLRTIEAYRAWAARAGSQAAALSGEAGWTPERRFARAFERLALPGFGRGPRFDLLTTLGRLGAVRAQRRSACVQRIGRGHAGGEASARDW